MALMDAAWQTWTGVTWPTGFQPNEEKGEGEDDESLCMFFGGKEKLAQARAAEMAMEDDTGVDWNDFYGDEEELDQAKADEQAMFARIWRHRERAPLPILGPTVHSMANDCKSSPGTNIGDSSQPPPWRPTPGQPSAGTNPVDQQIRRRRVKETKEERRQGDKRERRIRKTEEDDGIRWMRYRSKYSTRRSLHGGSSKPSSRCRGATGC